MIKELSQPEVRAFIEAHESDDPADLVLKFSDKTDLPLQLIAGQIRSRQKAKIKLPVLANTPNVIFPMGVSMEQCSSEATALYKSKLLSGSSLTDLSGGFGIDSYYFSKIFGHINYVEPNSDLCELSRYNFNLLGCKNINIFNATAEQYLAEETTKSNCYFIDPSRRNESMERVFKIQDCQPDVLELTHEIVKRKTHFLVKLSPFIDIQETLHLISNVSEVHVVAAKNECKEVLFLLAPNYNASPIVSTVNLVGNRWNRFEFTYNEESEIPNFSLPQKYLYEPHAAIMKAGGFNSIANKYGVNKLHRNSHLYTSEILLNNFPGRQFLIRDILAPGKKAIRKAIPSGKANITVRNFPESVAQIRKKTGLNDGGNNYLFYSTLHSGDLVAILCEKIN